MTLKNKIAFLKIFSDTMCAVTSIKQLSIPVFYNSHMSTVSFRSNKDHFTIIVISVPFYNKYIKITDVCVNITDVCFRYRLHKTQV